MKLIVQREQFDPAWNLALEQVLLETADDDIFLLWQNRPSIIIGRNQNAHAEINATAVEALGLPVVRRITGGGAVYHDLGNLNFSFIDCDRETHFGNFARYTLPIIEALQALGIAASLGGRNDIMVDDKKISGNAQCLSHGRTLHHGTLLFDVDLTILGQVLRPDPEKLSAKGIASVRSRVTNLRALQPGLTLDHLIDALCAAFIKDGAKQTTLTPEARLAADNLAKARYQSWAWNWGAAPPYDWHRRVRLPEGGYEVFLAVKKGIIQSASLRGDFLAVLPVTLLTDALTGTPHTPEAILPILLELPIEGITGGLTAKTLCALLTT